MSPDNYGGVEMIAPEVGPQGRQEPEGGEWVPEFEGQRPPFEPGNEAALKHGARSKRRVEEEARKVGTELLDRYPVLTEYPETYNALRRSEAITRMMFADLATNGLYGRNGEFRASLVARYFTGENACARLRASLGMTPESEAQVARDRAVAASASVDVVGELIKQGRATLVQQRTAAAPHDFPALDPEAVTEPQGEDHTHDDP